MKIIKIGGSCIDGNEALVAERTKAVAEAQDDTVIVVHGFGPRLRRMMSDANIARKTFRSASGVQSHFTDEVTLAMSHAAAALVQRDMAEALRAQGLSVASSLSHKPFVYGVRKKLRYVEDGLVRSCSSDNAGTPSSFDLIAIQGLLDTHQILLVAPIMHGSDCAMLSGDSDALAVDLALACSIEELVFLTDVDGFLLDGETVPEITTSGMPRYLDAAKGGMRKKLFYARKCVEAGVSRVVIRNLLRPPTPEKETVIHGRKDPTHQQSIH